MAAKDYRVPDPIQLCTLRKVTTRSAESWRGDVAVLGQLRPFHLAVKLGRGLHFLIEGLERSLHRLVRWIARVLGGIKRAAALEIGREISVYQPRPG